MNEEHRRRPHYAGTYPRHYAEKYKEQDPGRYPDTVERVIEKGSTPAGMHLPICVAEILEILDVRPGESGIDCTLGYGGHTEKLLEALQGSGHLCALDVDSENLSRTQDRLRAEGWGEELLAVRHLNFADIDKAADEFGPFDFLLADLGVSSMQLDDPSRGFSWKQEGPLDLRLDPRGGITAAERLQDTTREELAGMLSENADEPYAEEIARVVTAAIRKGTPVQTMGQLRMLVEEAVRQALLQEEQKEHRGIHLSKAETDDVLKHACQRTFQALRIDINGEYEALETLLDKLPGILKPGGRAAVLTFHSGEDRIVKKMFREQLRSGLYSRTADEVIRPSAEERERNPRSRSAKLRWAVR